MAIEHVTITDPDIHEPKGIVTASDGSVYVADGIGSGSWQVRGTTQYIHNVSNASNTTNCAAGVDTTLPMKGDGTNNFTSSTVGTGLLNLDTAFNSNKGALIVDNMGLDVDYTLRATFVNLGTAGPTVTLKAFLVFDKTVPGTGVTINSSPITAAAGVEQTIIVNFFGNGIEAIYVQLNSSSTRDYQLNGVYVTALENRGS